MKKTSSVYSEKEMPAMLFFQQWKAKTFLPLLIILTKCGINAMTVSVSSGVLAVFSLITAIISQQPLFFLGGIWLHLVLDGFDGALARYQGRADSFGSFIDVLCDHAGIVASCLYMLIFQSANTSVVLLYAIFYTLVIGNAFLLNVINQPYYFIFRPRIFVYLTLTVDYLFLTQLTPLFLLILTIILGLSVVVGLIKMGNIIRHRG